jgi:hypothetical protein
LAGCTARGLASDWRFAIACDSALQQAIAALAAIGYKVRREAHHHRVIKSLPLMIGASQELIVHK